MTTTTRTTRNASWAAVLTAFLAVLALVFGVLTLAAPATADPPTNPGNSNSAPGQNNTPPGQEDDGTPGASHDKMTICHYVEGKGETKAGYNIITMSTQAWEAHKAHHPDTMDVVYNGVACPTVTPTEYGFTTTGATASTTKCTLVNTVWTSGYPFTATVAPRMLTKDSPWTDAEKAAANAADQAAANTALENALTAARNAGQIDDSGAMCVAPFTCPAGTTNAGTVMTHAYNAADPADVAFCTPPLPDVVTSVEAATVEAPETVAPTLPGTVDEPEVVAVPAAATVPLPATVPAGDGSGIPAAPVWMLALLVLGATALTVSTVHLVRTTR